MTEDKNLDPEKNSESQTVSSEIPQDVPLPDPTLIGLISGLASQVMISFGIFPNPIDGSKNIMLHQGKHLIDTIAMLDEKTKGNQTEEETKLLENVLHELRMIYVAAQNEKQKRDSQ
ncbi:MAG: DUF1844 domain-containing protein [Planctomycetaceae bacterium]|jgi:hypothetical protein|nr:DUF1844 domain-containing protein [Planctomycetaceae bacterium]